MGLKKFAVSFKSTEQKLDTPSIPGKDLQNLDEITKVLPELDAGAAAEGIPTQEADPKLKNFCYRSKRNQRQDCPGHSASNEEGCGETCEILHR
jgi:hypothetical protein